MFFSFFLFGIIIRLFEHYQSSNKNKRNKFVLYQEIQRLSMRPVMISGVFFSRVSRMSRYWQRMCSLHWSDSGTGSTFWIKFLSSTNGLDTGLNFVSNLMLSTFFPVQLLASIPVTRATTATSLLGDDNNDLMNLTYLTSACDLSDANLQDRRFSTK